MSSRLSKTSLTLAAVLVACSISFSVGVKAADESKSEVATSAAANVPAPATNSTAVVATPAPVPTPAPVNPRVAVIERISQAALQAMSQSNDPVALVLSAKYVRDANLKPGEQRDDVEKADLQAAALMRAQKLTTKENRGFVYSQIAMFCLGFPAKSLCNGVDPAQTFAESAPENVTGWLIMAGRDFSQGLNAIAQTYLEKAANAKSSAWFYKEGAANALKYAKKVKGPAIKIKAGDAEAAVFTILNGITLPAYKQFSQMCNPDGEGKLPEGRYPLCRQVAQLLIDQGETNVELFVGYKALERLANGEKKADEAKLALDRYNATQAAIDFLWKSTLKFPPQTGTEAVGFKAYFADFVQYGEVKATRNALKRAGKSVDSFMP